MFDDLKYLINISEDKKTWEILNVTEGLVNGPNRYGFSYKGYTTIFIFKEKEEGKEE